MIIEKVFLAIRHTIKGGQEEIGGGELDSNFIGDTGREAVCRLELPRIFCRGRLMLDFFGSGLTRTWQHLLELVLNFRLSGHSHDPLFNMGNEELFAEWEEKGLIQAAKETGSAIRGLHKVLTAEEFQTAIDNCFSDIKKALKYQTHSYALGIFHTPTIELAVHGTGYEFKKKLQENQGMIFVLLDDDTLQFYGPWESGDDIPHVGDGF